MPRFIHELKRFVLQKWENRHDGKVFRVNGPKGMTFNWLANHRYPESILSGDYEEEFVNALLEVLSPGDCFFDVGANAGYFSLCAKVRVGDYGQVLAFEPLPENIRTIKRIQAANPRFPFELVETAVAERDGEVIFEVTNNNANCRMRGVHWELSKPASDFLTVKSVNLKPYIQHYLPNVIKVDVEAAEYMVLSSLGGPQEWNFYPIFFIEFHGCESYTMCRRVFDRWGYGIFRLDGQVADDQVLQFAIARPFLHINT